MEKLINAGDRLRDVGIPLTLQRLAIAQVLLPQPIHLTADQVLARVKDVVPETSRATVYNTLKLFREKGLVRELIVDAERTVFDSNTSPHFHLYDGDTGQVTDIPADTMRVIGTPALPEGMELEEVDIIIRVRGKRPMVSASL
jgi:Fur family iron response transcriptional regulator